MHLVAVIYNCSVQLRVLHRFLIITGFLHDAVQNHKMEWMHGMSDSNNSLESANICFASEPLVRWLYLEFASPSRFSMKMCKYKFKHMNCGAFSCLICSHTCTYIPVCSPALCSPAVIQSPRNTSSSSCLTDLGRLCDFWVTGKLSQELRALTSLFLMLLPVVS